MTAPLHLVTGDDALLLQRATEDLVAELRAGEAELEVTVADVAELDHLPELRTTSLFGGRTCVVLRGAEGLSGDLKREVEEYVAHPDPDAILVVVARGTGSIQSIARRIKQDGELHEVTTPAPWADREWAALVRHEARRLGRDLEPQAVAAIREVAGDDPSAIAGKVSQVVAGAPGGGAVTAEQVHDLVEGLGSRGAFAVADAIVARDPGEALVRLRGAYSGGEEPLAVLGAIAFRIRQLLALRSDVDPPGRPVRGRRRAELVSQARTNFDPGELVRIHHLLARADVDCKGGSALPPTLVLELAVVDAASRRPAGRPWDPTAA